MKEIDPNDLDRRQNYKLLTGSIVPRPIAWVSSHDLDGNLNLAPYSFFTAVTSNPPTIIFCPGRRSADLTEKDTFNNVMNTREFVVNFVTDEVAEAMNQSAVEANPDVDEFVRAGVTPIPSKKISVPRVAESKIHFECKLTATLTVGDGHIVVGEVVYMHFADGVYEGNNYINIEALKPIGRLSGSQYAHINDLFTLDRPPSERTIKP